MSIIGITTTVPIEVLIAKGYKVVDLNNVFITSEYYHKYIDIAERKGFPKSSCAWIKGIYGACVENNIKEIVGVVEGDCSSTKALVEVLKAEGVKIYPFSYPHIHNLKDVKKSINEFISSFNVDLKEIERIRAKLNKIRNLGKKLDKLTYIDNKATGFENHLYQVSFSDFNEDVEGFKKLLESKIKEISKRKPNSKKIRLGFIGVPPMTCDIYEFVEKLDAHFVYNEVQREFAFPRANNARNIYEQYYDYTYPYDLNFRLKEIKKQIHERKIDGIIHYTQAFCHRAIEDIIVKKELNIPVLNIEGDKLNTLDARTKLRIEAFLDMLSDLKEME
ncbi:2-hydroxyacyl-CoA dehydratase family protein [Thermohalobacter berrensis]|uniref:2-hydroxyglutaryl-CoA dehydratase n=1 Tax=Thermohalobacter berrensis TaxID=99594 RepID=A0A419SW88_9FIRM|nr:2-hydroxyacyl-CoA dehydratase [Thermohalobacter berrensis]RKD29482.1 2-hydroxyglutaryl-CoA dehydratase [Thermohalobacter berrensis]